ncbi:unnamed protein product, partial [Meganyctiphanes norvegica]
MARSKTIHPPYTAMVAVAIKALNERKGSSRQAILKYILASYTVVEATKPQILTNLAIRQLVAAEKLVALKGHFRLTKKEKEATNTGDKPYKCTKCEVCFARKDHLDKHVISHSKKKPFQC